MSVCHNSTIKYVIVLYMNAIVPRTSALSVAFPAILQRAGKAACFAADEFFSGNQFWATDRRSPTPRPR